MKKLILLVITILSLIGCEKEKSKKFIFGFDQRAYFSYVDGNGEDLLNPSHPNALQFEFINLYTLEDGEKKLVYDSNMTNHPKGIVLTDKSLFQQDNNSLLIVELSGTLVLEFGSQNSDTISYDEYTGILTYNGKIVWDYDRDGYRIPIATIVK